MKMRNTKDLIVGDYFNPTQDAYERDYVPELVISVIGNRVLCLFMFNDKHRIIVHTVPSNDKYWYDDRNANIEELQKGKLS